MTNEPNAGVCIECGEQNHCKEYCGNVRGIRKQTTPNTDKQDEDAYAKIA